MRHLFSAARPLALRVTGLLFLLGGVLVAHAQSKTDDPNYTPQKSTRVITHAPEVPQPPLDVPQAYRDAIVATAKRYSELYTASKLSEAIAEARKGLELAEEAKRPRDEAEFLKAALYASWLMGESSAGFEYGQRLIAAADKFNDDRLRSIAHRVIGSIFGQLRNREKQREHVKLSLTYAERAGDANLRIAALNNYGNLLMAEGDLTQARATHEEVQAYREAHGHRWDLAGTVTNLADIAEREGDLPRALDLHQRALDLRAELDDRRGQVRSLTQVAGILRKLKRPDDALPRVLEAQERAKAIGGYELLNMVNSELARVQEDRGDFAAALAAERLAARNREQMAGEQARVRAAEFEARLELDRKQDEIEQLDREKALQAADLKIKEAEISRQQAEIHAKASEASTARWQRVGLVGIIMIGIVGVLATVSQQRLKLASARRIQAETLAAKEAAEQANALKSRLIAIVSHDIRSPLSSVISLTEEMREDLPPGKSDERLDIIAHQTHVVVSFAQDLLDATALESGGIKLHKAVVDLSEVVRASLGHFAPLAAAKRQSIQFLPAGGREALVDADGNKLQQVVSNLVSNALKYSPVGARVKVGVAREAHRAILTVADEGPGIAPEEIARLFQPFSQLRAKPTGGESSHGLGLSIAHELVRLHEGILRVEPGSEGGSIFIAEFPVAA